MNVNVLVSTVRKGFQDIPLTDCDLGKEERGSPSGGELKHDLQLGTWKNGHFRIQRKEKKKKKIYQVIKRNM